MSARKKQSVCKVPSTKTVDTFRYTMEFQYVKSFKTSNLEAHVWHATVKFSVCKFFSLETLSGHLMTSSQMMVCVDYLDPNVGFPWMVKYYCSMPSGASQPNNLYHAVPSHRMAEPGFANTGNSLATQRPSEHIISGCHRFSCLS